MKRKEDLIELIIPPEKSPGEEERRRFGRFFFYKILLPSVREGTIKDSQDLYNAIEEYRHLRNTDFNIAHVFRSSAGSILTAIKKCKLNKPPKDFFEIDIAFSLICEAVTKDERLFFEPGFHGVTPKRTDEVIFRNAVKKVYQLTQLDKSTLSIPHD
ncbi:hypothetical protein AMJ51_02395 [Microgenomates bacterium DG_75]|nr:MAG: hypothetical protein AMJ51_02395 [Microgenomates bacterium DG_75]